MKRAVPILLVLLCSVNMVTAETRTVVADGSTVLNENDQGRGRDRAIADAMRNAVQQALGAMVASETIVQNLQLVEDNILVKSRGYITDYEVVKEGSQQSRYAVTIKAQVSDGSLKEDLSALGLLMARVGMPRVLFMLAEQNIGQELPFYWWNLWGQGGAQYRAQTVDMAVSETTLREGFLDKGFNVVDISASTGKFDISNAYRIADLTNDGARIFGKKLAADIVIKGKALVKEGPQTAGSTVRPYLAEVTATVIRVDNGQVLGSARGKGTMRHISQQIGGNDALSKAARAVSDQLIEQITAKWENETNQGRMVQVTVHGLGSSNNKDVREFLGRLEGVQSVMLRSTRAGVGIFDVLTTASAQELADQLRGNPVGALEMEASAMTSNTMEVSIGPKSGLRSQK